MCERDIPASISPSTRQAALILLLLIIWLGFALRLHQLASVPLRGDEAFSALNWAGIPLRESLTEIATIEPHPPLTYLLFRTWRLHIGGIDSPFALRLLPALGNLIGVSASYALALRLSGSRISAIAASFLWAIHPYEIWHSQDFRNYAIWAGLSVTSLWLGLRLIDRPLKLNWLLHACLAIAGALIFYTEAFMSIALALFAICYAKGNRRFLGAFLSLQGIVIALALAALLILQARLLASGDYPGNLESLYVPDFLFRFLPILALGETVPGSPTWLWIGLVLAHGSFAYVVAKASKRQIQFVAATALLPCLLLGLLSTRVDIFHPRYVLGTVPAFVLLISLGSARLASGIAKAAGTRQSFVMPLLLAPWIMLSAWSLHTYHHNAAFRKSPAWDELGDFLNSRVAIDDLVVQLSADAAFGYYYRGPAEARALPSGPWQSVSSIIDELEAAKTRYSSIYVVSNAIPSLPNAHVVEDWMRENMQLVTLSDASGLAIRQYQQWTVLETDAVALASFGGLVELLNYRFFDDPLPTGELLLHVNWLPRAITNKPLKSFVHVYGETNPATGRILWSQDDQFPQSGRIDSSSWPPGRVFRDVYYLPSENLRAGSYELRVGWYEPLSGDRLHTNVGSDTFLLQDFDYPPKP